MVGALRGPTHGAVAAVLIQNGVVPRWELETPLQILLHLVPTRMHELGVMPVVNELLHCAFWSMVTPPELLYIWLLSFDELRLAMNAHLPVVRPLLCYARRGVTPMHQKMSSTICFSGTNSLSLRNNLSPSSVKPSGHLSSDGALTAFQYLLQWSDAA